MDGTVCNGSQDILQQKTIPSLCCCGGSWCRGSRRRGRGSSPVPSDELPGDSFDHRRKRALASGALQRTQAARAAGLRPLPRIVNGLSAAGEFPTVGAILKPLENPESHCTGTLIGCETVLTAAHCFDNEATQAPCDLLTTGQVVVHFQHAGFFAVSSITCHPDESFAVASDLAVLELATPVSGIAPSPINTISKPPPGTEGVIVGYGRTEGDLGFLGRGIKRAGAVTTSTCQLVPDATHTCWDFTEPRGPAGSDASTCNGDSGGPLFVNAIGVGAVLAGVTSGGQNPACDEPTFLFDADVYYDRQWVQTAGGADLATPAAAPCRPLGPHKWR